MNFSVENICNIGGCVLIFVLLALLLFKPSGVMPLIEGQNNNNLNNSKNSNNNRVNNNVSNNNDKRSNLYGLKM